MSFIIWPCLQSRYLSCCCFIWSLAGPWLRWCRDHSCPQIKADCLHKCDLQCVFSSGRAHKCLTCQTRSVSKFVSEVCWSVSTLPSPSPLFDYNRPESRANFQCSSAETRRSQQQQQQPSSPGVKPLRSGSPCSRDRWKDPGGQEALEPGICSGASPPEDRGSARRVRLNPRMVPGRRSWFRPPSFGPRGFVHVLEKWSSVPSVGGKQASVRGDSHQAGTRRRRRRRRRGGPGPSGPDRAAVAFFTRLALYSRLLRDVTGMCARVARMSRVERHAPSRGLNCVICAPRASPAPPVCPGRIGF